MLPDNLDDINRYYGNVFIRLKDKEKNEFRWVYIPHWEHARDLKGNFMQPMVVRSKADQNYLKARLTEDDYDLSLPDSQYYFSGKEAMYLKKETPRHQHRSLALDNSYFTNPLLKSIPKNFWDGLEDRKEEDIYRYLRLLNTKVPEGSFDEIREKLIRNDHVLSVPLPNKLWCLSKALSTKDDCILWYKLTPVCRLSGNRGALIVQDFKQEVMDNFPTVRLL